MKYVYTKGTYAQFEGYEFLFGKPTEITNPATLQRIAGRDGFAPYSELVEKEEVKAPEEFKGNQCEKCGRVIKQGMFMHRKHCKGTK